VNDIKTMFPRASKSFLDANPLASPSPDVKVKARGRVGLRRGIMNGVEKEFAVMMLEAQKRAGEILRYEFEGITLRFANVKYTPDFVIFYTSDPYARTSNIKTKFIEVKGPFIKGNRERAVERFRHAKTYWTEFTFEMHQKTKDGWHQLI